MRRFPFVLASSVLCALLSIGCKQGLGERCEQDSDCSGGYYCKGAGLKSAEGGTCQVKEPTIFDAAPPSDAAKTDTASAEAGGDVSDAASDLSSDVSSETGVDTSSAEVASDPDGATGG